MAPAATGRQARADLAGIQQRHWSGSGREDPDSPNDAPPAGGDASLQGVGKPGGASWPTADGAAGRVGEAGWSCARPGPAGATGGVSAVAAWPAMSPTMHRVRDRVAV
jgi:hypothetical protein